MEKTILVKVNGEVEKTTVDNEVIRELKKQYSNPCFNCEKGYASKCPKIASDETKSIMDFDFITDGYQIVNKQGELDELIICQCNNYELDHERVKLNTLEAMRRIQRLKESIKILYFDAIDPEEADRVQEDLFRRGQLIEYDTINNRNKVLKK